MKACFQGTYIVLSPFETINEQFLEKECLQNKRELCFFNIKASS